MMAFIGWFLMLGFAVYGVFALYFVVAMSGWNGKIEWPSFFGVLLFDSLFWYATIKYAPFSIVFS